jgi:hypothetical protein
LIVNPTKARVRARGSGRAIAHGDAISEFPEEARNLKNPSFNGWNSFVRKKIRRP